METIYFNGNIITMENQAQDEQQAIRAVLVRDGRIAAVGTLAEVKHAASSCEAWVDLEGKTMLPAFLDAHGHLSMTTQYVAMADLSGAHSFADIVHMLKAFQQQRNISAGEMIVGYAYDHNFLQEETYPTKEVLDQVSTENPIVIWHASAHMCVVNSCLLNLLQIDKNTADVTGGVIGRYAGSREPNGYLEEVASQPVRELQSKLPMDYASQILEAQMQYIRNGILTIQDGAADQQTVALCRQLADQGLLLADVVAYPCFDFGVGVGDSISSNGDCIKQYVNHYKIGGYKMLLDGSPQGKSAWLTEPYEGEQEGYCGYPWLKNEEVEARIATALSDNQQLLIHCNGDAAADQLLDAYEKMLAQSDNPDKTQLRPVMIHCQTVREDQLDRMVGCNMIPSIFVAHTNYWGDVHLRNLGAKRAARISPVRSALERGMRYNFHTDTPVVQPLMFHTIWSAVNRITGNGVVLGPEQRIDVYDALKGLTINAAYAYFEEDEKGSIGVGKKADLIIVDQNPLTIEPLALKEIQVLACIKDGQTIYRRDCRV